MLAIAASRLSHSDTWRRKDEKTKERSILGNWRDRRGSKESEEMKETGEKKETGDTKEPSGSWRVRKQQKAKMVDETGVYGAAIPAEWKLQKMYKQLKIGNNKFTTWLVESIYPCSESLPPYITLSRKQAKDHPKYDIIVNNITELAHQTEKVPSTMLDLLDHLIAVRSEYSYWMSRKSTENLAQSSNDSHIYYIKVLKEVKTILAGRMEPQTPPPAEPPKPAKTTNLSPPKHNPTLGKRKNSSTSAQGPDRTKAVKTESTQHQQQQQEAWKQVISDTCDKMADKECAPTAKPMSYAAALRVAVTA